MNEQGPPASKSRTRKIVHVLLWTVLFYALTVGIAKLVEWLDAKL